MIGKILLLSITLPGIIAFRQFILPLISAMVANKSVVLTKASLVLFLFTTAGPEMIMGT